MKTVFISQNWLLNLQTFFSSIASKNANNTKESENVTAKEAAASPKKEEWNYLLQLDSL